MEVKRFGYSDLYMKIYKMKSIANAIQQSRGKFLISNIAKKKVSSIFSQIKHFNNKRKMFKKGFAQKEE